MALLDSLLLNQGVVVVIVKSWLLWTTLPVSAGEVLSSSRLISSVLLGHWLAKQLHALLMR